RIVPVAVSYELDPCDATKARELLQLETTGSYKKTGDEDVSSIGLGISGSKGRVHVHFGTPLQQGFESPEQVAAAIDDQIISGYRLFSTNHWAYNRLYGQIDPPPGLEVGSVSRSTFEARIDAMPAREQRFALANYANALRNAIARQEVR
ncbi:MAG: glycerol acyltransferase, partial [Pseudomonadota bacterium]